MLAIEEKTLDTLNRCLPKIVKELERMNQLQAFMLRRKYGSREIGLSSIKIDDIMGLED